MHKNADHNCMAAQTQGSPTLRGKGLSTPLQSCNPLTWAPPMAFLFSESKIIEMKEVDYCRQRQQPLAGCSRQKMLSQLPFSA